MFNKEIAVVLVAAKKQDRWTPVCYLVKHGLFAQNIAYLESQGHLSTTSDDTVGTLIKLTVDGYYSALAVTKRQYTKERV